jgi:hypothetical protein
MHLHKVHLFATCLLVLVQPSAMAERIAFRPNDIEVCPTSAGVLDPEFDALSQRMVFFDWQNNLKVLSLNPDGTSASPSCAGTLIDTNTTLSLPGFPLKNGPEWGRSQTGVEIFYTKLNTSGQPVLARAWENAGWQTQLLQLGTNRGLPLASTDLADPQARIMYPRLLPTGGWQYAWRESNNPSTEAKFPGAVIQSTGSAPRWVDGQRAVTTTAPDAQSVAQAIIYKIDTQTTEVLTSDTGQKSEVWMWSAPEFAGESIFMTMADSCCLRIYRKIAGTWTMINSINATSFSSRPAIFSPQPFVYKNRSYVVMQLSSVKYGPGDIWIAAVDPAAPMTRMVSDPNTVGQVRSEPETMATPNGMFVYYTMVLAQNQWSLRRATTGL